MSVEDLNRAFEALQDAHRVQPASTLHERRALLSDMLRGLREYEQPLLDALEQDLGKPEAEARLTEFFPIRKEIGFMRRNLGDWMRPERRPTPCSCSGPDLTLSISRRGLCLSLRLGISRCC